MELWDLQLGSGILWDHMEGDALAPALAEAVARLRGGQARARSGLPLPAGVKDIVAVWLAGGRAHAIDVEGLSAAIDLPVWCATEPDAVPERGAQALLPDAHALVTLDLGQSHLKVFTPRGRLTVPRPWDQLPMAEHDPGPAREARARLRAWVVQALSTAGGTPDAVVAALPCALEDDPTPGPCTYAGLLGDRDFVPAVVAAAGWRPRTLRVLNDAELAAAAASVDPRLPVGLTLVLTLGFGVGGALLHR